MRLLLCVVLLAAAACAAAFYQQSGTSASRRQQQPAAQAPRTGAAAPAQASPNQEVNDRFVRQMSERIAGRENEPAERVFKNIQWLKGVPAGRLLRIMNAGYSRALGVSCTHCHVAGEWEKDDKPTKNVACDMARMVGTINGELLKKIPNLRGENPTVNCTTCHRGQTKPALNLPEAK